MSTVEPRIHIALGVPDIAVAVTAYTEQLGCAPEVLVPGEYALWRTASLNFSVRRDAVPAAQLRHLGWEDAQAPRFTAVTDATGLLWERFSAAQQREEIAQLWPEHASR